MLGELGYSDGVLEDIWRFREAGALISFDVNFRGNLWSGEEARRCVEELLPYIDIFFCSAHLSKRRKYERDSSLLYGGFSGPSGICDGADGTQPKEA